MNSIRIYLPSDTLQKFRKVSMEHFGYGRGSLSKAAEDAILKWMKGEEIVNELLRGIVNSAKEDKNVISVFLFGSYARGDINFEDVDVAFLLEDDKVNSPAFLEKYTDEKGLLDLSILNRLPVNIQNRVLEEGKVLYCSDQDKLYDYSIRLSKEWEDFKPRFKRIITARNQI